MPHLYQAIARRSSRTEAMRLAGKTAELVRYGGEDHILTNPHNLTDYFARIAGFVSTHASPPKAAPD